jgi:hypothetical protein
MGENGESDVRAGIDGRGEKCKREIGGREG